MSFMESYEITTRSPEETYAFGKALGACLQGGETLLLLGGMGAGKTAVTRGIVAGMGIDDDVSSPTYTLVNTYEDGDKRVHHFDLYRLTDEDALYEMGFEDFLTDGAVLIIEWPQVAEGYPFEHPMTLEIGQPADPQTRLLKLSAPAEFMADFKKLGW